MYSNCKARVVVVLHVLVFLAGVAVGRGRGRVMMKSASSFLLSLACSPLFVDVYFNGSSLVSGGSRRDGKAGGAGTQ